MDEVGRRIIAQSPPMQASAAPYIKDSEAMYYGCELREQITRSSIPSTGDRAIADPLRAEE